MMEESTPKISFITPYYEAETTVGKMLHPLDFLPKGHRDILEWIIVDDHSSDNSYRELVDMGSVYPEVRVIRCAQNGGASYARNMGIEHARGDFLIFMDADIQIGTVSLEHLIDEVLSLHADELKIFTAGLHQPRSTNFATRYKTDYMNAIFAPYRGERKECAFLYGSLCGWRASYNFRWPNIRYGEDTYLAQDILRKGHSIHFYGDILLEHHKNYNLKSLLINDYRIPFYFAHSFMDFKNHPSQSPNTGRKLSFSHSETWQLLAIFISGLLLLSRYYPLQFILVLLILWSLANRPLFKEVLKGRAPKEQLASYAFTLIDQWFMGFGILFGLIHARFFTSPLKNPKEAI